MTQYFSPHIPITDRINYLCKCVCVEGGGVEVKWAAEPSFPCNQLSLSRMPCLFKCLLINFCYIYTWCLTSDFMGSHCRMSTLGLNMSAVRLVLYLCKSAIWITRPRSPSLVGITVGVFHPENIEIKSQCDASASESDDSVAAKVSRMNSVNTSWSD